MAITGELLTGQVGFSINGQANMVAGVELVDDQLGRLGMRNVTVDDPATIAAVVQFVEQMLPSLSAALGVPVTLPVAPTPDPDPVP